MRQALDPHILELDRETDLFGGIQSVTTAGTYSVPLIRQLIDRLKYHGAREVASILGLSCATALQQALTETHLDIRNPVLVPVPLHSRRRRERGFNQAELLARTIGTVCGIPVMNELTVRLYHGAPQARVEHDERWNNVSGLFGIAESAPSLRLYDLIIVDDVITTGATIGSLAAMLQELQPRSIHAVAIARSA